MSPCCAGRAGVTYCGWRRVSISDVPGNHQTPSQTQADDTLHTIASNCVQVSVTSCSSNDPNEHKATLSIHSLIPAAALTVVSVTSFLHRFTQAVTCPSHR